MSILYGNTIPSPCSATLWSDLQLTDIFSELPNNPDLQTVYHRPLSDIENIANRQRLFQTLQDTSLLAIWTNWQSTMQEIARLEKQLTDTFYKYSQLAIKGHILWLYTHAVEALTETQSYADSSFFLQQFVTELLTYKTSQNFSNIQVLAEKWHQSCRQCQFTLHLAENTLTVNLLADEPSLKDDLNSFLAPFLDLEYTCPAREKWYDNDINHIDAAIQDKLLQLYPPLLSLLQQVDKCWTNFQPEFLHQFTIESQFYLSFLQYTQNKEALGISFTYPHFQTSRQGVGWKNGYNLALCKKGAKPVPNDFMVDEKHFIFIITGPNQGGKTCFACLIGQIFYLASLGLPVPAEHVHLFLPKHIFTHFASMEDEKAGNGKLREDLLRLAAIAKQITAYDIFIANELFSSTTLQDAYKLNHRVLDFLSKQKIFSILVTFLEKLSTYNENICSLVSTVDASKNRTFRIIPRPADGKSYVHSLAIQYHLDSDSIRQHFLTNRPQ